MLVNLVGNAIDAMPEGGRQRIHCRTFQRIIGRLTPRIELAIADTGIGMTAEVLERRSSRFTQRRAMPERASVYGSAESF